MSSLLATSVFSSRSTLSLSSTPIEASESSDSGFGLGVFSGNPSSEGGGGSSEAELRCHCLRLPLWLVVTTVVRWPLTCRTHSVGSGDRTSPHPCRAKGGQVAVVSPTSCPHLCKWPLYSALFTLPNSSVHLFPAQLWLGTNRKSREREGRGIPCGSSTSHRRTKVTSHLEDFRTVTVCVSHCRMRLSLKPGASWVKTSH